ncbi:uncharacterized protein LOC127863124 [Dreissena polymorpha]|uniref:uncharacterized protein LOC127863124 n=1 Tax=Dreissena polymorpha TaxID=45954 RepID=UPI002264A233|nr:uncharacterized protein LOC127863124 [Dreissena polymorpha]XP_052258452.1 uncharacterized protein LOC127863124 [Dreissena polymorpha]XP_052258453.1 uncharacterized protein LOC127863124 [Dreissena polymorpha]XP_052258454.1 uncharacterized protein LOC127863124 [Dreissena polymorpha]
MPTGCCAPGCTQRQTKGGDIHFYRFPKNDERRWKWIIAMKRMQFDNPNKLWEPLHNQQLCSLHFLSGQPSTDANHPDYVPSRFHFTPVLEQTPKAMDRYQRAVKRRRLVLSPQPEKENTPLPDEQTAALGLLDLGVCTPKYQTTGTDLDPDPIMMELGELKKSHSILQEEYQHLLNEYRALKETVEASKFTYRNLNNSTMITLTGLPSVNLFRLVLSFVCLSLKPMGKLCAGNIILMVLMKLKLGLTNKDLALRFKVAPTQVSAIINIAIPVIADKLNCLICWLPKEEIINKSS